MLGEVYQFERSNILERQRDGIAKARERGVYKGRPQSIDHTRVTHMLLKGVSMRKIAAEIGISLSSVQRIKNATHSIR